MADAIVTGFYCRVCDRPLKVHPQYGVLIHGPGALAPDEPWHFPDPTRTQPVPLGPEDDA